jgi:hypothetical protein
MKGGSRNGCLSLKKLTAEGLEGGLLYWAPWVMKGSIWGWAAVFMWAQLGTLDFRWLKVALEVGRSSLWEICEGNLERGLPCWEPWRICRKGSGDGHLFP